MGSQSVYRRFTVGFRLAYGRLTVGVRSLYGCQSVQMLCFSYGCVVEWRSAYGLSTSGLRSFYGGWLCCASGARDVQMCCDVCMLVTSSGGRCRRPTTVPNGDNNHAEQQ